MKWLKTFDKQDIEDTVKYAEQECRLNQKLKDGCSLREQLESVERQTKKKPKELCDLVELPTSCYSVWRHFITLDSTRTSNGYSANPIPFSEIKTYFDLIQETPEPWEIVLLNRLDRAILNVYAEQAAKDLKQ